MDKGRDMRSYIFGRDSTATFQLPKTYYSGTCVLNLDMVYDDQMDRLFILEIMEAAFALALRCATGTEFNRGGVAIVGLKKVLHITIIGTEPISLPAREDVSVPQRHRVE